MRVVPKLEVFATQTRIFFMLLVQVVDSLRNTLGRTSHELPRIPVMRSSYI